VHLIQTDGVLNSKADFLTNVPLFCHRHRVARPYRKNEQSLHRKLQPHSEERMPGLAEIPRERAQRVYGNGGIVSPEISLSSTSPGSRNETTLTPDYSKEADCRIFTENKARCAMFP